MSNRAYELLENGAHIWIEYSLGDWDGASFKVDGKDVDSDKELTHQILNLENFDDVDYEILNESAYYEEHHYFIKKEAS